MWGSIIGAAAGAIGKRRSSKKSQESAASGGGGESSKLAEEQYRKQAELGDLYTKKYKDTWEPFEQEYADVLRKGVDEESYVGRATADVQQSFEKGEGQRERQMSRMGIDPSSGRFQQMMANSQYARSLAEVGARGGARDRARQMNLSMKAQGAGMGRELLSGASRAYSGAGGGFMGQANWQQQQQGMRNQEQAGQGEFWGNIGSQVGQGIEDWLT